MGIGIEEGLNIQKYRVGWVLEGTDNVEGLVC